jgi:hypothetical protein
LPSCKTTKKTETKAEVKSSNNCNTMIVSYEADIKPIIEQNCMNCHGYGSTGGYNFSIISDLYRAGKSGDLLGTIKWEHGYPRMPAKAEKLDSVTINKIECWVNNGMK